MRSRDVNSLPIEQSRQAAVIEAMAVLPKCNKFVLVFIKDGDGVPEVVGYGSSEPDIVNGLEAATQYLANELRDAQNSFDVVALSRHLCGQS